MSYKIDGVWYRRIFCSYSNLCKGCAFEQDIHTCIARPDMAACIVEDKNEKEVHFIFILNKQIKSHPSK